MTKEVIKVIKMDCDLAIKAKQKNWDKQPVEAKKYFKEVLADCLLSSYEESLNNYLIESTKLNTDYVIDTIPLHLRKDLAELNYTVNKHYSLDEQILANYEKDSLKEQFALKLSSLKVYEIYIPKYVSEITDFLSKGLGKIYQLNPFVYKYQTLPDTGGPQDVGPSFFKLNVNKESLKQKFKVEIPEHIKEIQSILGSKKNEFEDSCHIQIESENFPDFLFALWAITDTLPSKFQIMTRYSGGEFYSILVAKKAIDDFSVYISSEGNIEDNAEAVVAGEISAIETHSTL